MSGVLNSVDTMIANAQSYGMWRRCVLIPGVTPTAGNTTSGWVQGTRYQQTINPPTFGTGISGMYMTYARMVCTRGTGSNFGASVLGLEYVLGTLTLSGNVFADGVVMPNKTIQGASVATCADISTLYVSTTGTATTPTITITYKNERGTGSRTATMTLPTSPAAWSAFQINPHLQAGDSGITDITNMSSSVTTGALVLKATGLLILGMAGTMFGGSAAQDDTVDMLATGWPPYLIESTDKMVFYNFGDIQGASPLVASLAAVAETT